MSVQFAPSVPTKRLVSSILSTDMAFSLVDYLSWGGIPLVAADFPPIGRGVFRNTTNTIIEFFTFDPATIAGPITILTRGNDYRGGTANGVQATYNWPAAQTLVELGANPPAVFEDYADKTSDETIGGIKTFSSYPVMPGTAASGNQAVGYTQAAAMASSGAATSSTSVLGIVKMSTAPVSAPSPIAVGDNDGRVPTQGENDALVGTSGTAVSSSNKLVDAADVSAAAASGKIVRATGTALPALSGASLTNIASTQISGLILTVGFKNGLATRDMTTSSGGQTIAHGLGTTPKSVRIFATVFSVFSNGFYNGSTVANSSVGNNGSYYGAGDTTNIISLGESNGNLQVATITVDGTNINLTWTKTGSPTQTAYLSWEAVA
jgi:hypothetical protein